MLNLDTHVVLAMAEAQLSHEEESRLRRYRAPGISAIVLWEIERLHRDGRIARGLDDAGLRELLDGMTVWPLDAEVCLAIRQLDFSSDPADEIIAATSLAHHVRLMTRDARLLNSALLRRLGLVA